MFSSIYIKIERLIIIIKKEDDCGGTVSTYLVGIYIMHSGRGKL